VMGKTSAELTALKFFNGHIFYDSSETLKLYKVPNHADGSAAGTPETIATKLSCDDFFGAGDAVFMAKPGDVVSPVTPDGQKTIVTGTLQSN